MQWELATVGRVGQKYDCLLLWKCLFVRHLGGRVAVKTDPSPHWKCQVLHFSNIQILSVFLAFLIFDPAIESAGVQKSTHTDPISKSWP